MKAVFISIVICFLIREFEAKDFCELFSKNGFQIDSMFEKVILDDIRQTERTDRYLIIGENVWILNETSADNWQILSTDLTLSEVWTNVSYYRFNFHFVEGTDWYFGLWPKNNKFIDVFKNDINQSFVQSIQLSDEEFEPVFKASGSTGNTKLHPICFGETFESSYGSLYIRKFRCFSFELNPNSGDKFSMNYPTIKTQDSFIDYMNSNQLIWILRSEISDGFPMYFLYQLEKSIHYCRGYADLFILECKSELKLLIDCSQCEKQSESKSSSWLWIINGLFVFLGKCFIQMLQILITWLFVSICFVCGFLWAARRDRVNVRLVFEPYNEQE